MGIAAQEIAARAQGDKVWLPVRRCATKRPRGLDRYGSTRTALELLLGHEDFVDHVNDSVTRDDVGLHDIGGAGFHLAGAHFDGEFLAVDGFCFAGGNISCHDLARDDVVGQYGDQLLLVFRLEEALDRAFGELGEGLVGGAKTVNGPGPLRVSTSPPAFTAATRVSNCPAPAATLTMFFSSAADDSFDVVSKSAAMAAAM